MQEATGRQNYASSHHHVVPTLTFSNAVSKPKSQFVICCQRLLRYYSVLLLNEAQFGSLAELLEKAACGKTPFAEDCIFEKFCQVPDYCIYLAANFFWQDFSKKSAGLDTALE